MYPVYEMDSSVRTEIQELPTPPEFSTPARTCEFVAHLAELMGRMNQPPTDLLSHTCGSWEKSLPKPGEAAGRCLRGNLRHIRMMSQSMS